MIFLLNAQIADKVFKETSDADEVTLTRDVYGRIHFTIDNNNDYAYYTQPLNRE